MRLLGWVLVAVIGSGSAFAAPVLDPQGLLGVADRFFGHPSFESRFQVGHLVEFNSVECRQSCDATGCREVCDPPHWSSMQVVTASSSEAWIRSIDASGQDKLSQITALQFDAAQGNPFRFLVDGARAYGIPFVIGQSHPKDFIEIESAQVGQTTIQSGETYASMTMLLKYHAFIEDQNSYWQIPYYVTCGRTPEAIGAILKVGFGLTTTPALERIR